jgi:hypothetical protein
VTSTYHALLKIHHPFDKHEFVRLQCYAQLGPGA